jgi:DNA-binding SARP family transcriptional activator
MSLDPAALELDVTNFVRLAGEATTDALEQAALLYRGDFLEGFDVDEEPFESWLMEERERLRDLAIDALARALAHQRKAGALPAALRTARQLLTIDPLQEPVHRTLMRLLAQAGQRAAALRQYQQCVAVLRRELGVEPELETKQLYQEILRQRTHPGVPTTRAPRERPRGGSRRRRSTTRSPRRRWSVATGPWRSSMPRSDRPRRAAARWSRSSERPGSARVVWSRS